MLQKKNIVLNGIDEINKRGLLSFSYDGEMVKGQLRLYNFGIEPKGIISLGMVVDGKVIKAGLTRKDNMLFTFLTSLSNLPQTFSCAVVNFSNGQPKPILFGTSNGNLDKDMIFDQVVQSLNETKNITDVENVLDKYGVDYEENEKKEIEEEIDKFLNSENEKSTTESIDLNSECDKNCESCEYKKYYMKNNFKIVENSENSLKKETEYTFYDEIKQQIDNLFENNPSEDYLETLIPNSKWVKVDLKNGDYYVLGLIYENNNLKYICYGVPGVYQKNPPRELSGYPIWFPLETEKPEGFGYWLSYQDADNGESVKAVVV